MATYLKENILETAGEITFTSSSFDKAKICNTIINNTICNTDFMEENGLHLLRHIYFIDQYCNSKFHFINESGRVLKSGLVATIRI